MWIGGQPGSETIDSEGQRRASSIPPFRLLKLLPKTVKTKLEVGWEPIYRMMEMGIEGDVQAMDCLPFQNKTRKQPSKRNKPLSSS